MQCDTSRPFQENTPPVGQLDQNEQATKAFVLDENCDDNCDATHRAHSHSLQAVCLHSCRGGSTQVEFELISKMFSYKRASHANRWRVKAISAGLERLFERPLLNSTLPSGCSRSVIVKVGGAESC